MLQDAVHWYRDTRHATWSNTNPRVSHVSSLATCNSHVAARVLTASDDGCVRVWAVDAAATRDTDSADGSAAAPAAAARQVSRKLFNIPKYIGDLFFEIEVSKDG